MFHKYPIVEGLPRQDAKDLMLMMKAARSAGRLVCQGYDQMQVIEEKEYGNLVTKVDEACDAVIHGIIGRARRGETILSEERNPDAHISRGRAWVVDPLDATSAFSFRCDPRMIAIMIARTIDGKARSSVVHFPLSDEMFYAVEGRGAYKGLQPLHCHGDELAKSWVEMNQQANVGKESAVFDRLRDSLRSPGGARLVSSSPPHSGVGVRIAEGHKRLGAVVHDNNPGLPQNAKQAPWDVIPVKRILEEAGGVVVNLSDGESYDPFKPRPFIMAASKELADEIIGRSRG